jgi:hypothetical protein
MIGHGQSLFIGLRMSVERNRSFFRFAVCVSMLDHEISNIWDPRQRIGEDKDSVSLVDRIYKQKK